MKKQLQIFEGISTAGDDKIFCRLILQKKIRVSTRTQSTYR